MPTVQHIQVCTGETIFISITTGQLVESKDNQLKGHRLIENADQSERLFQTVTLWRISGMRVCMCILMSMNDTC